jgi:hypothetical protein
MRFSSGEYGGETVSPCDIFPIEMLSYYGR